MREMDKKLQTPKEQLQSKRLQIKTFETGHVCLTAHEVNKTNQTKCYG